MSHARVLHSKQRAPTAEWKRLLLNLPVERARSNVFTQQRDVAEQHRSAAEQRPRLRQEASVILGRLFRTFEVEVLPGS